MPSGACWNLLDCPAVPIRVLEEDELAPIELLDLGNVHSPLDELCARRVNVGDDHLEALQGTGLHCHDSSPHCNRACRSGRRELHEPEILAHLVVVVGNKADLLCVEGLCAINV